MIDPPRNWFSVHIAHDAHDSPEILKFRFSLHMVKDDWPPRSFKV